MSIESRLARIERLLAERGGVGRLRADGRGMELALTHAVRTGRILRLRRGWYALPTAPAAVLAAVRIGGAATSITVARMLKLWCIDDGRLHVWLPPGASRLRMPTDGASVCLHRSYTAMPWPDITVADIATALLHLAVCQPLEYAVAAIDSALDKGLVAMWQLAEVFSTAPERVRRVLTWCDANSQSGTESIVRVRLRRRGIRVRTQVRIRGVGRVDLVIGDRLVIECDSREFHDKADSYAADRARDLELLRQGYREIRLTYAQVVYHWDEVEPVILELIRSRAHLWPRKLHG